MKNKILKIFVVMTIAFVMVITSALSVFAEQTNVSSVSVDYNEANYTTDYNQVIATIKNAMLNRENNVLLMFAYKEKLNGTTLRELVFSWIEKAWQETEKANEGDYIRYHIQSYGTENGSFWSYDNKTYYYYLPYVIEYYATAEQEKAVTQEIKNVVKSFGFTESTTQKEKCDAIYEYITKNVRYDYDNKNDSSNNLKFSAYAALINKTAVCQGYATLFYRLARECGLSARVIAGNSYGENHAWNIVKIDDYYYYVDATWDEGRIKYSYYLKGSDTFLHHTCNDEFNTTEFKSKYPISKTDYSEANNNQCESGHEYGGICDSTCNVCGAVRDAIDHTYQNESDAYCSVCGDVRELGYDQKINLNQQINVKYSLSTDFDIVLSNNTVAQISKITTTQNGDTISKIATISPLKSGYVSVQIVSGGNVIGQMILLVAGCERHTINTQILTNPTCTKEGSGVQKCAVCGFSKNIVLAKTDHQFENDCDKDCNVCGEQRSVPDHVYDNSTDESCNICGEIRPITHNFIWITDKAATCGENGIKHEECTDCGIKRNENTVINATENHTYTNDCDKDCNICGKQRSVPDHIYDNSTDESCNICGEIRDIVHTYIWVIDEEETCGANGTKHEECTHCGAVRNINTPIIANGNHTYDDKMDNSCNVCGYLREITPDQILNFENSVVLQFSSTQDFELILSDPTIAEITDIVASENLVDGQLVKIKKATITPLKPGYVILKFVSNTGKVLSETIILVQETEHKMELSEVIKNATCDENGSEKHICKFCGYTQIVTIDKKGHTYTNVTDTTCNECGDVREITPDYVFTTDQSIALQIELPNGFNVVLSDETVAQITKTNITQQNIGGTIVRIADITIKPLKPGNVVVMVVSENKEINSEILILFQEGNHKMQLLEVVENPSCLKEGKEKYICEWCGYIEEITTPQKDHQFNNDICDLCGTQREKQGPELIIEDGKVYYYLDGEKQIITGLVKINGVWYYISNGVWDTSIDTLHKINGKWFLIKGGIWKAITGLEEYKGKTFYVVGGKWNSDVTDLKNVDGKWYYIQYGKWNKSIDTLHKINGKWFLIKKGMWNKTTGLVDYQGKTFLVKGGKWDSSVNTLYKKGTKLYAIKSGKVYTGKTVISYNGKKYYCNKGYAQTSYSGKVKIGSKTYTVKKGIVK